MNSSPIVDLDIPGVQNKLALAIHGQGDQMISSRIQRDGFWEYYETLLILRHLQEGDVFVDVGANIGYYSVVAADRVGDAGKVLAFEPVAENFKLLLRNIQLNGFESRIQGYHKALSNQAGEQVMYLSSDNFGDHRFFSGDKHLDEELVSRVRGDQFIAPLVERIDFLKLDTQGSEFYVLSGMRDLLTANQTHLKMVVEFCPFGLRESGASGRQLLALLDEFPFQYEIIDHHKDQLIPVTSEQMAQWIDETDTQLDNEGFINLFVSPLK